MPLNVAALHLNTPSDFELRAVGSTEVATFYRDGVGKYWSFGHLRAAGLSHLTTGTKFSYDSIIDICKQYHLEHSIRPNPWQPASFRAFRDEQFHYAVHGYRAAEVKQAVADFEALLSPLFAAVSKVVPGLRIRGVENPRRCLSLSKGRKGLFVWPDWRDSQTISIVNSTPGHLDDTTELINEWMGKNNLRLHIPLSF